MKYDSWSIASPDPQVRETLRRAGHHPILSAVLASRGCDTPERAEAFLRTDPDGLHDPFLLNDMDRAADRLHRALRDGEKIAVYGDYDVDGITSVCLLAGYLQGKGADFVTHIPDRTEEGYGLNELALRALRAEGVSLVITVDSGVTAIELAEVAHDIGLSLIITDHHHCRETLPRAEAVVNPYRPDSTYPFQPLAGVGVAFKLVCAMEGDQREQLAKYAELVALGTLADVMPVTGENRILVSAGLRSLESTRLVGLRALIRQAGLQERRLNAASVGFGLAPRLNAAGRVARAETAVELLLAQDPARAEVLARELCEMNQLRQQLENNIAAEAFAMLEGVVSPRSIVLSGEGWHQGVIGIVASRLSEHYRCPVFLICVDAGVGKGSARSVRGINLVDILTDSRELLENFGGHEMAAGFTLRAGSIAAFSRRVEAYCAGLQPPHSVLDIDLEAEPAELTPQAAEALCGLEPFGGGNRQPVFMLADATLAEIVPIGSGKHMRARLEAGGRKFQCVWFGMDVGKLEFARGDVVDAAFRLEMNRFRGEETMQLQLADMRPSAGERMLAERELSAYRDFCEDPAPGPDESRRIMPTRAELGVLWRYLKRREGRTVRVSAGRLARELAGESGYAVPLSRLLAGLDIFSELGLITLSREGSLLAVTAEEISEKRDLLDSPMYQKIKQCAEGGGAGE